MAKISKTFSIEQKIFEKFESICKDKNMNKSIVIQQSIRNFIGENYDLNTESFFKLKFGDNPDVVKVTEIDEDFVLLDNGNKMNILDFEMLYEEEDQDVRKVLEDMYTVNLLQTTKKTKTVDIDIDAEEVDVDFLNQTPIMNPDVAENIFRGIDPETKIFENPTTNTYSEIMNEKKQALRKKYQIKNKEKVGIIQRINEKLPIFKNVTDTVQMYPDQLQNLLSYIIDDNVEVLMDTDEFTINIPIKYQIPEITNLLTKMKYKFITIEEKTILDRIKENINKIDVRDFITMSLSTKTSHMMEMLTKIVGIKVEVIFNEPLYMIKLSNEYRCQELFDFIKSYGINEDHIIWN